MKKLTYLLASLFMVALLASCSEKVADDDSAMLKKGNVACDPSYDLTSGRINWVLNEATGEYYFDGFFPAGFHIWTDGTYVNWSYEDPDGLMCLDGITVIVKGGPAANIFTYEPGVISGEGLAAPVNSSGKPAGLSNLTICFNLTRCEQPPLVIAVKTYMTSHWACTATSDILFAGYYDFIPGHVGYKLYYTARTDPATADLTMPVGNLEIGNFDGDPLLEVRIDNSDMPSLSLTNAYLFVGTVAQYTGLAYTSFPYQAGTAGVPVTSLTFDLPF